MNLLNLNKIDYLFSRFVIIYTVILATWGDFMDNYILFLDESKPNGSNIHHLCLAGFTIKQSIYEKELIPAVKALKNNIFGTTEIILHEKELRFARDHFKPLRRQEKREKFWSELRRIFANFPITILAAAIHIDEYKTFYHNTHLNNEYFIVLQVVLENFVHFLRQHNGRGSIYIESTNPTDDTKLRNIYHKINANGTLFFSPDAFQETLNNINFLIKADNNIGLQLADFIPGTLNRACNGLAPKKPNIYDLVNNKLYDGEIGMSDRFGFKNLP